MTPREMGGQLPELFTILSDRVVDDHRYVHVVPTDQALFAQSVAPLVTAHYFDEVDTRARLLRSAQELSLFSGESFEVSEEDVQLALGEELDAVLPEAWKGDRKQHLDVQRSEFGEILAAEALKQVFGTVIPASRIKHKEIPDQQTRGADVIGIENLQQPRATLVLGEVKGSQDRRTPPGVVSGMEKKLGELVGNRRALLQELCWLRDHADDPYIAICSRLHASFILKKNQFEIVLAPLLVRTSDTHHDDDPGSFKEDPDSFGNPIRWVSIVVEGDLFEIAQEVYRVAREGAA
ncbi:Hachiman antiphage defense system protein HamA [Streptomyces sp. NPDC005262]|uniref:Hachiman antiphage defense system protein HamA n=1 Tax=Streptomyces sp. NPDC005262 TaxID=3364710 RepID=UPI003692EA74